MTPHQTITMLKTHFPNIKHLFDQVADTKASEATYKQLQTPKRNFRTVRDIDEGDNHGW